VNAGRVAGAALVAALVGGCTLNLDRIRTATVEPIASGWPWHSSMYAARTDAGVVVFDLGWYGVGRALERGLARIGARPDEVAAVFLTHSHRDHIAGWNTVRQARFYLDEAEVPLFLGRALHADLPSRAASAALRAPGPWEGELALRPFAGDTAWVLGSDTIRAFRVRGHTAGSTAYLFRGILFAGDAVHRTPLTGFGRSLPIFTDDVAEAGTSLASLFDRALPYGVEWVCTAHGKCAPPDERFLRKVLR
jgi:glyoxylase-like metal-dependent hydrolase (beta-lactamase superfamily II)